MNKTITIEELKRLDARINEVDVWTDEYYDIVEKIALFCSQNNIRAEEYHEIIKQHTTVFHYMSQITGELCENKRDILSQLWWWLKHYSSLIKNCSSHIEYIKYFFCWDYSEEGF